MEMNNVFAVCVKNVEKMNNLILSYEKLVNENGLEGSHSIVAYVKDSNEVMTTTFTHYNSRKEMNVNKQTTIVE
jgi:hypothetical protein